VQVRIREKGAWLDWQSLEPDGGPDLESADVRHSVDRVATAPIVTAGADAVQVRVDSSAGRAPAHLELLTVDSGRSAADANPLSTSGATAHSAVAAPDIISRAQ
jgi:hypothetical protein